MFNNVMSCLFQLVPKGSSDQIVWKRVIAGTAYRVTSSRAGATVYLDILATTVVKVCAI